MTRLTQVHEGAPNAPQLVFVHGLNLLGSELHHLETWMHNPRDTAALWPHWVGVEAACGCWIAQYPADASVLTGPAMGWADQGGALLNTLATERALKNQPLILIGHSLGGLVIKQALVQSANAVSQPELKAVAQQVKAVVFIATPHQGSQLANLVKLMAPWGMLNPNVRGMFNHAEGLQQLNDQFKQVFARERYQGRVFAEGVPTVKYLRIPFLNWRLPLGSVTVVDRNSSDPALHGVDVTRTSKDHIQISRSADTKDEPCRTVLDFLRTSGLCTEAPRVPPEDWPALPELYQTLSAAERRQLESWGRSIANPATSLVGWVLFRYATLRLGRLGGDESGGPETFVNLRLQPLHANAGHAAGGDAVGEGVAPGPLPFESVPELIASDSGRGLWLLRGSPGAGKSTLLRELELRCLHEAIDHWRQGKSDRPVLCVRLSLAEFDASCLDVDLVRTLRDRWFVQCCMGADQADVREPDASRVAWDALRTVATLRPLVDGLNEIRMTEPARQLRQFVDALHRWGRLVLNDGCAAPLLTVRQLNYMPFKNQADLDVVRVVDVLPWTHEQIMRYCDRRFPGRNNPMWSALWAFNDEPPQRERSAMLALFANPFNLAAQCWLFGQASPQGGQLARNRGVLLGRIALLRLQDALTRQVAEVVNAGLLHLPDDEGAVTRLVAQPDFGALHQLTLQGPLLTQLEDLALQLHRRSAGGWARLRPADALLQQMTALRGSLEAAHALKLASQHPNGDWQFDHQLWQEYLAASALARRAGHSAGSVGQAWWDDAMREPELQEAPQDAWELPMPQPSYWDQCLQLAVQVAEPAQNAEIMVRRLMSDNLALAGRAALTRRDELPAALLDELRGALLARSASATLHLRQRIEAGLLLGHLSDTLRYAEGTGTGGHGARYLLPLNHLQIPLPQGVHTIGGLKEYKDSARTVDVTIAKDTHLAFAPVTNAEFACFVEAEGYGHKDATQPPLWWHGQAAHDWWHGRVENTSIRKAWLVFKQDWLQPDGGRELVYGRHFSYMRKERFEAELVPILDAPPEAFQAFVEKECRGAMYRRPAYWEDDRFNNPLQPVVGVSLWEAQAYCRWLSLQHSRTVRLPTEAEWEVAARGGALRGVHWPGLTAAGPSATQANQRDTRLRATSPVGVFVEGTTPEGWVDMCGQVWEWTDSPWTPEGLKDSRANSSLPAGDTAERAVRGGSWNLPSDNCRAAFRSRDRPVVRDLVLGFRVVVCPIQNP